jgi:nitrile hydratase
VNRTHDVGGAPGHGPVEREPGEPPFHHEWEARVFVLNRLLLGRKVYNLDEFRHAIEKMMPEQYRAASYYERWAIAIERLLAEKGVLP